MKRELTACRKWMREDAFDGDGGDVVSRVPGFARHKKSELRPHQMARMCEVPGSPRTKSELRPHQMARKSEVPG